LDDASDASLFFKCESFQKVGAFTGARRDKTRSFRSTTRPRCAASRRIRREIMALPLRARGETPRDSARIVMPSNSAKVKVRAVEGYGGAQIVFCEPTEAARDPHART